MKFLAFIFTSLFISHSVAEISASANLRSSYVWHGQPLSDSAVIDGSIDYAHDTGISLGIWASSYSVVNKDPNTDPATDLETETANEVDYYLGYDYDVSDDISIGVLYTFLSYTTPAFTDYDEWSLHFSYKDFTFTQAYYEHFDGVENEAKAHYSKLSYEKNWNQEISSNFHIGYTSIEKRISIGYESYLDYLVGVYKTIDSFKVGLEYTDTNRKDYSEASVEGRDLKDQRVTFLVSRIF